MNRLRIDPLILTAYVALAAITASGVLLIDGIISRWQTTLLLLIFGFLISRYPVNAGERLDRPARLQLNLVLLAQTLIICLLIFTQEARSLFATLLFDADASNVFAVLFFILAVAAPLYNDLPIGAGWVGLFSILMSLFFIRQMGFPAAGSAISSYLSGLLFFGAIASALRSARQAQNTSERLLLELQVQNHKLEQYAGEIERLAVVEERNRLAREVHDTIGHRLTVAAVQLEAVQRLAPSQPEKAAQIAGTVREQVREALNELRQTVGRLREPVEAELALPQALRRLSVAFQEATNLKIHLNLPENSCEPDTSQRLTLFRAAQEGLTNIQRHAQAHQVWLTLSCDNQSFMLTVADDGRGPSEESVLSGFGLRGLHERAARLGGEAHLESRPGGGALLSLQLPRTPEP